MKKKSLFIKGLVIIIMVIMVMCLAPFTNINAGTKLSRGIVYTHIFGRGYTPLSSNITIEKGSYFPICWVYNSNRAVVTSIKSSKKGIVRAVNNMPEIWCVYAKKPGTTTLTITVDGKMRKVKVTVKNTNFKVKHTEGEKDFQEDKDSFYSVQTVKVTNKGKNPFKIIGYYDSKWHKYVKTVKPGEKTEVVPSKGKSIESAIIKYRNSYYCMESNANNKLYVIPEVAEFTK